MSFITASVYLLAPGKTAIQPVILFPSVLLLLLNIDIPVNTKHLYNFVQRWTNVEDVGPALYKCYTNVFLFAGMLANKVIFTKVGSTLFRHLRRWHRSSHGVGSMSHVLLLLNIDMCTQWCLTVCFYQHDIVEPDKNDHIKKLFYMVFFTNLSL